MVRPRGETWFWAIVVVWAAVAAALGLYGWWSYERALGGGVEVAAVLTVVNRTIGLFFANMPDVDPPADSLWLLTAQLMAPLVTVGAAVRIGLRFFSGRLAARRIRGLQGHTVVCGATDYGLAFAVSERRRGHDVVLVDADPLPAHATLAAGHGFNLVNGDPLDGAVLEAGAIRRAARLIVTLPDDGDNLETAMLARSLVAGRRKGHGPLLANVAVKRRHLWRQLVRSDAIERMGADFEILPFNLAAWAARHFTWDQPLWRYAWLRDQPRIHAVLIGYEDYAEALVGQLPAAGVHVALKRPRLTILSPDAAAALRRLDQAYPELSRAADFEVLEFPIETARLDADLMARIAAESPVTAVFVCRDKGEAGLGTALSVRDAMARTGQWGAPVYVHMSKCDGVEGLLVDSARARRFEEVIQAFGIEQRLCDLNVLEGRLELVARAIHAGYSDSRAALLPGDSETLSNAALSEWRTLPETFRESNRRAADHIPAKLASAGCLAPPGTLLRAPASFRLCRHENDLERLARLEHDSWMAGRYLDGWRYTPRRDDRRKHHPNLVAYAELDEPTRDFDRGQIRLLDERLIQRVDAADRHDLIRDERFIGLLGASAINAEQADWVSQALRDEVLPALLKRYPDAHLTLMTALTPESELAMVNTALDYLADQHCAHGLLVIEGVAEAWMLEDYKRLIANGRHGNGREAQDAIKRVSQARERIVAGPVCEWVIDLSDVGADHADPDVRKAGYRRAVDYVARRADALITPRPAADDAPGATDWGAHALRLREQRSEPPETPAGIDILLDVVSRNVRQRR